MLGDMCREHAKANSVVQSILYALSFHSLHIALTHNNFADVYKTFHKIIISIGVDLY